MEYITKTVLLDNIVMIAKFVCPKLKDKRQNTLVIMLTNSILSYIHFFEIIKAIMIEVK